MEVRVAAAGRGWDWLVEGFALFRRAPAMWFIIVAVLGLIWLASLFIPLLGPLLFHLMSPLFFAGLMMGCRALDNGEPLELRHLFAGFGSQAAPLVTIGGVYLVGTVIVMGIVLVTAGGSMLPTVLSKGAAMDIETLRAALRSLAIALAIGAIAYLPLIMLIWFAPPLIAFEGVAPLAAMRLSFSACVRNTMPFLVYGLAILGAWIVLSLPAAAGLLGAFLGVLLLVASIPSLIGSVYASYKDVFAMPAPPAATTGGNPFLR